MNRYKVEDIIGNFGVFFNEVIEAESSSDAREQILEEILENIDNYIDIYLDKIEEKEDYE